MSGLAVRNPKQDVYMATGMNWQRNKKTVAGIVIELLMKEVRTGGQVKQGG